jgi:hypothetical protein
MKDTFYIQKAEFTAGNTKVCPRAVDFFPLLTILFLFWLRPISDCQGHPKKLRFKRFDNLLRAIRFSLRKSLQAGK